jgi:hypothetical protein
MPSRTNKPSYIDPARLYSLRGFQADSGISATRISAARKQGIRLTTLEVGKRIFVRGSDAIHYIEQLAAMPAA